MRSPVGGFFKRSEADKFSCLLYYFCNLSVTQHPSNFFVQSDQRKWCLPSHHFVQKEGKNQSKEHRAGTFALCPLPWSCHPNLPCVSNFLFLGDLGKSGAGWSCKSLTLFVPVFGDLSFLPFFSFGDDGINVFSLFCLCYLWQ